MSRCCSANADAMFVWAESFPLNSSLAPFALAQAYAKWLPMPSFTGCRPVPNCAYAAAARWLISDLLTFTKRHQHLILASWIDDDLSSGCKLRNRHGRSGIMRQVSRASSRFCGVRALLASVVVMVLVSPLPAQAALLWNWSFTGTGVAAAGTFGTSDTPNNDGFYQITDISGFRNGVTIASIQPVGSAIPGNEGFPVDDLVNAAGLLTKNGFGFQTVDGNYSNPFFADFLATPGFLEVFTQPASSGYSELPIVFTAVVVPEPGTAALVLVALAGLTAVGRRWRYRSGNAIAHLAASPPI